MMKNLLLVALGGGAGSIARYLCSRWITQAYPHSFPWGTFVVNISGCFLIGLLWAFFSTETQWSNEGKLLLITGLCGGFTTFSAFTLEGIGLLKENKTGLLLIYTGASVITGLLATYGGIKLIKQLL
jgi:fluoride exporter